MRRGRRLDPLVLTTSERETMAQWTRRPTTAQALALRARVILACAAGHANGTVAARLHVTRQTVGKWRARFLRQRLGGLLDEPRPGAPRTVTDAEVEQVVRWTLETTPKAATHWSTRSMAKRAGLSQSTVSRIWRAFGLQPHRTETFTLSADPLVIEKVRDIVGLYLNPPDRALVLSVDEQGQIQALDRTRPRYHVHYTPTGASWLNLVERWFALLTEKPLRRGVHRSTEELEEAIYRYTAEANKDPKPFIWTKTAEEILAAVARFCQRTSNSGH